MDEFLERFGLCVAVVACVILSPLLLLWWLCKKTYATVWSDRAYARKADGISK